jgi:hypothetical protein
MMVIGVYIALAVFIAVLRMNRHWWLSEHLFSEWGPRTDVPCMTRRELFVDGLRFLLLGTLCAVILATIAWVLDRLGAGETPAAMLLTFLGFILSAMGFVAAAYLIIRGLFRSRRYVPLPHCGQVREPAPGRGEGSQAP